MFSHRNSSGFCCFAMKRPLQKLKGNVLCVFEKPQCGCKGWWFSASLCGYWLQCLVHCGTMRRAGCTLDECAGVHRSHTAEKSVMWARYVWALRFPAHNSRVLWHDILRRDLCGGLTEGSAVVGKSLFTTVVRICLIKMEVVSVKFMKASAPDSESDTWGGSKMKLLEMCQ